MFFFWKNLFTLFLPLARDFLIDKYMLYVMGRTYVIFLVYCRLLQTVSVLQSLQIVQHIIMSLRLLPMKLIQCIMDVLDTLLSHMSVFHPQLFDFPTFLFLPVFFLHHQKLTFSIDAKYLYRTSFSQRSSCYFC